MSAYSLPQQTTRFVGRKKELGRLGRLLVDPAARLITLVGPGGMGKTRIAIEAALRHSDLFSDYLIFVDLNAVDACDTLDGTVSDALARVTGAADLSLEQIAPALEHNRLLLILDNCDYLQNCSASIQAILETCPTVTILATSRGPFHLSGEWTLPLSGMDAPSRTQRDEDVQNLDSVVLFATRAQQTNPALSPEHHLSDIARVCQLVEGMPLAVELAAAWTRTLSPRQIAAEIQHNLNILATSRDDVAVRHRSIAAVFRQSWNLLDDDEQTAFARLTIFRGGFSREAAQSVAGVDLRLLDALIGKALVRRLWDDHYDMHELLRRLGEARLEQNTEEQRTVLKLCATYYAGFLQRQKAFLREMRDGVHLGQLSQEISNIHRAVDYLLAQGQISQVSDSITALTYLYQQAGWLREGQEDFGRIVTILRQVESDPIRDLALARALIGYAYWLQCLGLHDDAVSAADESQSALREPGAHPVEIGLINLYRARGLGASGKFERATQEIAYAGSVFESHNWAYGVWQSNVFAAEVSLDRGDLEKAQQALRKALEICQHTDYVDGQAYTLAKMTIADLRQQQFKDARERLLTALTLSRNHVMAFPLPLTVAASAMLLTQANLVDEATRLAHISAASPASDHATRRLSKDIMALSTKPETGSGLGHQRGMRSRYAVDPIDSETVGKIYHVIHALGDAFHASALLTPREREVLSMLARGSTNRQIARALDIAEGTVKRYTHHLFSKLGAQNRAEAVLRAKEQRLI